MNTYAVRLSAASGQYLFASDNASLSITGDITIETWIRILSTPNNQRMRIVSKNGVSSQLGYAFEYSNVGGTNRLELFISNDGSSQDELLITFAGFTVATWYHVAVTWQASTKTCKFYINTIQTGSDQVGTLGSIYDNAANLEIGANNGANFLDADLDDLRIWNTIKTSTDFLNNYQRELAGNEANLQAYYKFNNNYNDSTANANNLTPSGLPTFVNDVPFADSTTTSTSMTTTSTSSSTSTSTSRTTSTSTSSTSSFTTSTSTTSSSTSTTSTSTSTTTTSTSTTSTSTTSTSSTTTLDFRIIVEKIK